jgi:hypothetical protein
MKTLVTTSALALAATLSNAAFAAPVTATATPITSTTTTSALAVNTGASLTTWQGTYGAYPVFQAMTAEQQAAELRGAVPATQANPTLPDTLTKLPAYKPGATAQPFGYGTTDVLTSVRQAEACPTTSSAAVGTYTKVWQKSATYGNSTFGAGYLGKFTLGAVAGLGSNDKIYGEAIGKADVTVLGATGGIEGKAYGQIRGSTASDNLYLKALGVTLWSHSGNANLTYNPSWSKTLASASTLIWLGPVPVTLSASGKGTIGLQSGFSYAGAQLVAYAKPYGNLTATASAGIDILVASAGVAASLTLINAAVPATASLKLLSAVDGKSQFQYDVDVDAQVSSLSGNVSLWAKVWYLFGSKTWSTTVASWSGVTGTYPVVDVHGCTGKFMF